MTAHPRIAWVGVGAAGIYYAARLIAAGQDVHLLLRSDYETVKRDGLTVQSIDGDLRLRPERLKVYRDPAEMPAPDLVIITLKTTANAQLPALLGPLVKAGTALLTLQNGLGNEEVLAEWYPRNPLMGGIMFVCINRTAPGVICHSDAGAVKLGNFGRALDDRARAVNEVFRSANVRSTAVDDLRAARWEKLIWNIPFNGLGAALDATTDVLLATPAGRQLVAEVMREVAAAAAGEGIVLPEQLIQKNIDVTATMGAYQSSMQVDRRAGRPLETDAILGQPVAIARRHGVAVPRMEMLLTLLRLFA